MIRLVLDWGRLMLWKESLKVRRNNQPHATLQKRFYKASPITSLPQRTWLPQRTLLPQRTGLPQRT